MRATSASSGPTAPTGDATATPFADVYVTITEQEQIALMTADKYWQTLHRKAVGRAQWRELRYQRIVHELKARAAKAQAALHAELELAQAHVRDLQKRLFSSTSERSKHCETRAKAVTCRAHRGQQRGSVGHGRTMQTQLPAAASMRAVFSCTVKGCLACTAMSRALSGVKRDATLYLALGGLVVLGPETGRPSHLASR